MRQNIPLTAHIMMRQPMVRSTFYKIPLIFGMAIFLFACTGNKVDKPIATIDNPGKYLLKLYPPPKEFSSYSMAKIDDREFLVMGDVVIPSAQSAYFLSSWEVFNGETLLDIGTGSGVQAIFAADKASSVVATDINPLAIEAAALNAKRNGVSDRIEVRQGDLFAPVKPGEKFDVILSNINYPHDKWTEGLWPLHERFFAEVKNHLKQNGRIYYQSGEFKNVARIHNMAKKNGLIIISMRMDAILDLDRRPIVYLLKRKIDL